MVEGEQIVTLIWDEEGLLGSGYEWERPLSVEMSGEQIAWTERVQVVRSLALAERESHHLEQRLAKAEATLRALTLPPGRGRRPYRDEATLLTAVADVVKQYGVTGLLQVTWQRGEEAITRYGGRGRGSPNRPVRTEVRVRYVITEVRRDEEAIQRRKHRLGWRIQVTNLPVAQMSLAQTVVHYRGWWCLKRAFHPVKDRPIGIRPLYVQWEDQIIGLTRLLTLALRLLTFIESQIRNKLTQAGETLSGLYEGQPRRTTDRPTGVRLLKAFARAEITLTRIEMRSQVMWHITPLSGLLERILAYLGLSAALYQHLAENSL